MTFYGLLGRRYASFQHLPQLRRNLGKLGELSVVTWIIGLHARHGLEVWMQPLVPLRAPKIFNLRSDPFERAEHEAGGYDKWFVEHAFVLVPAQAIVGQHLATFQEFPPRQKPGSFSVNQAMDLMMKQKSDN